MRFFGSFVGWFIRKAIIFREAKVKIQVKTVVP